MPTGRRVATMRVPWAPIRTVGRPHGLLTAPP